MKTLIKRLIVPASISLVGAICNFVVVRANAGMPARMDIGVPNQLALDTLGLPYPKHTLLWEGTRFPFLADVLPWGVSIGDILIVLGLAVCVVLCGLYLFKTKKTIIPA